VSDELLVKILRIFKSRKKIGIDIVESSETRMGYDGYDRLIESYRKIVEYVDSNSHTFAREYRDEDEMIGSFEEFFVVIDGIMREVAEAFMLLRYSRCSGGQDEILKYQMANKLLSDYLLWLEKFELAIVGMWDNEVLLISDNRDFDEIYKSLTRECYSSLGLLSSFGLGYLVAKS
jgi:hypothetical protein